MLEGTKLEHRDDDWGHPVAVEYLLPVVAHSKDFEKNVPWCLDFAGVGPEEATARLKTRLPSFSSGATRSFRDKLLQQYQIRSVIRFRGRWWLGLGDFHYNAGFWRDQHWNALLYPEQRLVDTDDEMVVAFGLEREHVFHEFCSNFGGMIWNPQFVPYGIHPPRDWHAFSVERWGQSVNEHPAWAGTLETYYINGNTLLLRNDGVTAIYYPRRNDVLELGTFEEFVSRFLVSGEAFD